MFQSLIIGIKAGFDVLSVLFMTCVLISAGSDILSTK